MCGGKRDLGIGRGKREDRKSIGYMRLSLMISWSLFRIIDLQQGYEEGRPLQSSSTIRTLRQQSNKCLNCSHNVDHL